MGKVYFISGHLDLTDDEFNCQYKKLIDAALIEKSSFVVGDARGADTLAQKYLLNKTNLVIVYHMFESPRNNLGFITKGGFQSDSSRDKQMTMDSDIDICWIRKGREKSGTAMNQLRRKKSIPEI